MLFSSSLLPRTCARAYAPIPSGRLWEWADENVWLENKEAAEPGPYRSAKTPWNRRLQELMQHPEMLLFDFGAGRWIKHRVSEVVEMKGSQSGATEGVLNGIRYKATFRPQNVIYTVDTRETARDIATRLESSLRKLEGDIFTGDDDDVGTFVMRLRAMSVWFQGSFSMGKFASKMAPLVISDESEEQGSDSTDTSTDTALKSRKKTADNGLYIALCKPKRKKGPIHRGFLRGNQEEFHIACPHCSYLQPLTFFREEDGQEPRETPFSEELCEVQDEQTGEIIARMPLPLPRGQTRQIRTGRLVFEHCKDLLGKWDKLRILREAYYECGNCRGKIEEHQKSALVSEALWLPTALGDPGVVSQHINDLYSSDANSSWGTIVLEYLAAKREGRKELQGFYNHRLGLPWADEVNKTLESDIRSNIAGRTLYKLDAPGSEGHMTRRIFDRLDAAEAAVAELRTRGFECDIQPSVCPPYRRGTIPCTPLGTVLGSDVGGNYAKWAFGVLLPNGEDIAVVDWGHELDPEVIAELMLTHRWPCADGKEYALGSGFMDSKHRKGDCVKACFSVPGRKLMPTAGLGGTAARSIKIFSEAPIPSYPPHFRQLVYNDREAKDEMYIVRLKKKHRRLFFPIDVEQDPAFMAELCAEELIEDENGRTVWNEYPPPNHWGDAVKEIIIGIRYLTRRAVRVAIPPAK
jgi:hypothetical protein